MRSEFPRPQYENTPGVSSPREVADVDLDVLRAAVLKAYNTRNGTSETAFESLPE